VTLHAKMAISLKPESVKKKIEDTVVFLTRKVIISLSFSIASYNQKMRKSLSQRNRKWN